MVLKPGLARYSKFSPSIKITVNWLQVTVVICYLVGEDAKRGILVEAESCKVYINLFVVFDLRMQLKA